MESLRIVFMGTPDFATESLKALLDAKFNIAGVITAPDKPAGRGRKLTPPPVKVFALEQNLTVLQPQNLKAPEFLEQLKSLKADLQIVVAFRMLPEVVWDMPPLGTFNLHASLLPHYRGAAPINHVLINGEKKTGVTTFFLQHEIDTGNLIFQEEEEIRPTDTAETLHDRLMGKGARLVVKTARAIARGEAPSLPQPDKSSKPAPKIFKEDCRINWQDNQLNVYNFIRGLSPYPGAWTTLVMPGKEPVAVKIFSVVVEKIHEFSLQQPPGIIIAQKKDLQAGTGTENLFITELQLAGKKRMKTEDFLKGFSILEGSMFE